MAGISIGDHQVKSPLVVLRRLPSNTDYCRPDKDDDGSPSLPPFDFPGFDIADLNRKHKHYAQGMELSVDSQTTFEIESNVVSIKEKSLEGTKASVLPEQLAGLLEATNVAEEIVNEHASSGLKKEPPRPFELPIVKREPSLSPEPARRETRPRGAALQIRSRSVHRLRRQQVPAKRRVFDKTNIADISIGMGQQLKSPLVVLRRLPSNIGYYRSDKDDDGCPPLPPFDFPGFDIADLKRKHKHTAHDMELPVDSQESVQLDSSVGSIEEESPEGNKTRALRDELPELLEPVPIQKEITEERGSPVLRKEPPESSPPPSPGSSRREKPPRGAALQTDDVLLRCVHCNYACRRQSVLRRHVKRRHEVPAEKLIGLATQHAGNSTAYKCGFCGEAFANATILNAHSFQCVVGQNKRQKTRKNTSDHPLSCDICGKVFLKRARLVNHFRVHKGERSLGERPFGCDVCGRRFRLERYLTKHMQVHTGERSFACDTCGATFSLKAYLRIHSLTHTGERPFECDICGRRFILKKYLTRHSQVHTGERPFACDTCGATFSIIGNLRKHSLTHTSERPFGCDICGRRFVVKRYLTKHSQVHTGERPFACGMCDATFSRKDNLRIHSLTHTGEHHFGCDVCGKTFLVKRRLVNHLRNHAGEHPFACDTCGKGFLCQYSLDRHLRVHTGERPFS